MFTASELTQKVNTHVAGLRFDRKPAGLYAPVKYVLSPGGKRIRPVLMLMAYNLFRDDVDTILDPAAGIEVYHNYTLLHDDVMDHADMRRGKATVHKVWDENTAILSGDAMFVLAYQLMARCPQAVAREVLDHFNLTSLEICEGQQLDMEFERRRDVSAEEYLEMIRLKTSVLLAASLKIGAIMGRATTGQADGLYNFGVNLGMAFQLKDDLLDVYGDTATFGKKIGGDILCNKKTFLLIKALEGADSRQLAQLNAWLDRTAYDPEEKVKAVTALYDEIGVKAISESKIAEYTRLAVAELDAVDVPQEKKQGLREMMNALMYRQS